MRAVVLRSYKGSPETLVQPADLRQQGKGSGISSARTAIMMPASYRKPQWLPEIAVTHRPNWLNLLARYASGQKLQNPIIF